MAPTTEYRARADLVEAAQHCDTHYQACGQKDQKLARAPRTRERLLIHAILSSYSTVVTTMSPIKIIPMASELNPTRAPLLLLMADLHIHLPCLPTSSSPLTAHKTLVGTGRRDVKTRENTLGYGPGPPVWQLLQVTSPRSPSSTGCRKDRPFLVTIGDPPSSCPRIV